MFFCNYIFQLNYTLLIFLRYVLFSQKIREQTGFALVKNVNGLGIANVINADWDQFDCPEKSHFLCNSGALCLPIYLRCNGVPDCFREEDELGCDMYTCQGKTTLFSVMSSVPLYLSSSVPLPLNLWQSISLYKLFCTNDSRDSKSLLLSVL